MSQGIKQHKIFMHAHLYVSIYIHIHAWALEWYHSNHLDLDESHWDKIPGYGLVGSTLTAVSSLEDCQRVCEEDITCRSVNYYPTRVGQTCGINTKAWGDESGSKLQLKSGDVDYYYHCFRPGRYFTGNVNIVNANCARRHSKFRRQIVYYTR